LYYPPGEVQSSIGEAQKDFRNPGGNDGLSKRELIESKPSDERYVRRVIDLGNSINDWLARDAD
jgi:hypothetical protein